MLTILPLDLRNADNAARQQKNSTLQIDVDVSVPHRLVAILNGSTGTDTGAVHQNVEATEGVVRSLYRGLAAGNGANITGRCDHGITTAQSLDGGAHGLACLAVDGDMRAGVDKAFCNGKTDTPTAARYQDPLVREIHVVPPLLLNDSLEHFQVDISSTDNRDDLLAFEALLVLEQSAHAESPRTFDNKTMLLEEKADGFFYLLFGKQQNLFHISVTERQSDAVQIHAAGAGVRQRREGFHLDHLFGSHRFIHHGGVLRRDAEGFHLGLWDFSQPADPVSNPPAPQAKKAASRSGSCREIS